MLVPWFDYNTCSITRDSQGKRVQLARQHAKVRDFTSRHACLEVKFGFRQVQVCFIGGSLPVILSSMARTHGRKCKGHPIRHRRTSKASYPKGQRKGSWKCSQTWKLHGNPR